jgi:hypothetical protein
MKTKDLIRDFLNGRDEGSASSKRLRIKGNKLINYSTVIALRKDGNVYLNTDKYSSTTSKHQNRVRDFSFSDELVEVNEEKINELIRGI